MRQMKPKLPQNYGVWPARAAHPHTPSPSSFSSFLPILLISIAENSIWVKYKASYFIFFPIYYYYYFAY